MALALSGSPPVSSPAQAGDPVFAGCASLARNGGTGCPAFAGHDSGKTPVEHRHSFRSAAGGRYWLVKMSSAFGRFLKS